MRDYLKLLAKIAALMVLAVLAGMVMGKPVNVWHGVVGWMAGVMLATPVWLIYRAGKRAGKSEPAKNSVSNRASD